MKKILFTLYLVLIQQTIRAQAPVIEWGKCFGGTGYEIGFSIQQTVDGGYVMAGYTDSVNGNVSGNHGSRDGWIVKFSVTGALEWQKCIGGTNGDNIYSIKQTPDGGYIVAGITSSNNGDVSGNHGNSDGWLVKLSGTGAVEWQKALGGTQSDQLNEVRLTTDGGYIVIGTAGSYDGDVSGSHGVQDYWVIKLSSTGTIEWQKAYGGTQMDEGRSIQLTADGGYILCGYTTSVDGNVTGNHGAQDAWVIKISGTGILEWQKTLGGTFGDYISSIQQTADLGYIMAGYTDSTDGDVVGSHGGDDAWVVKLSNSGALEWQKAIGGTNDESAYNIKQASDGGYVFTGAVSSVFSGFHGTYDSWVVKLSDSGAMQWQKCLGGTNSDWTRDVFQTVDGGFIVAGITISINGDVSGWHGGWDSWIVKLGPELSTNSFDRQKLILYPNPASGILNLQAEDNQKFDKIIITDVSGKTVLVATKGTTQLAIGQLAKGAYLLEAVIGTERWNGKFVKE